MSEPTSSSSEISRPRHRGRLVLAAATLLLLTFGAGVAVGVVGDRFVLLHSHRVIPRGHAKFVSDKVLHVMTRRLDLTPSQQIEVKKILDRHSDAIEKAAAAVEPVVKNEMKAAHLEVETLLNPEQKEKLRKMHARFRD